LSAGPGGAGDVQVVAVAAASDAVVVGVIYVAGGRVLARLHSISVRAPTL